MHVARPALLICALLLAPVVQADQFEYVDAQQARAALRHLREGGVIHHYCAPCGDTASKRATVRSLGMDRIWDGRAGARVYRDGSGNGYWAVEVNDEAIDLAYVYIRDGRRWRNLATVIGLKPVEVPAVLPKSVVGSR